MISKSEIKVWVQEIDSIITVFPQQVISKIIMTFLIIDFRFDSTLMPCNTHTIEHYSFDISSKVDVSDNKIVTKKYSPEWICVSLLPKFNFSIINEFKLCIEVLGNDGTSASLWLAKNHTKYNSFIIGKYSSYPIKIFQDVIYLRPGKSILTTKWVDNILLLFVTELDDKQEIKNVYCYKYKKRTIDSCDTILIGVGYYPQSVTILNCPTDQDEIWTKIKKCSSMEIPPYKALGAYPYDRHCEKCVL